MASAYGGVVVTASNGPAVRALEPLHADVETFAALRVLADGRGRIYSARWAGPRWAEQLFRQARAFGFVKPSGKVEDEYGQLDVLDAAGDVVQDFGIPTAAAFRWWYRKVGLRITSEDGK